MPLVQSAATLTEPVPLPDAIRSLVRFLMQVTRAADGLLLVRHYDADRQPAEHCRAYDADGQALPALSVPFARSVAGSAASMGQPCVMNDLQALHPSPSGRGAGGEGLGAVELQTFEKTHRSLLAAPMAVASGTQVVIELFDKPNGFTADDQHVARAAANLGVELMRQALGQRETHQLLFDAIAAVLKASEQLVEPPRVIEQLRAGLPKMNDDAELELCAWPRRSGPWRRGMGRRRWSIVCIWWSKRRCCWIARPALCNFRARAPARVAVPSSLGRRGSDCKKP